MATLVSVQAATTQNNTMSGNATKTTTSSNKTTITVTEGKPIIIISPSNSNASSPNYNRTGFTSLNVLTADGKNFPIKYSIRGGKLVGMLADKDRTTLVLVLNPGKSGGNMTVELPRNVIDSKGSSNADVKYQVKIDGKGVDYKEISSNLNGRVLYINFSNDNRFMEIIGTKMLS
jgi:hypothetical protein